MLKRRYQIISTFKRYDGRIDQLLIGKYWTKWGAIVSHNTFGPFLVKRDGRFSMVLVDIKTNEEKVLSIQ